MTRRLDAFLERLVKGRGPVEQRFVLKDVVARVIKKGGLNRQAQNDIVEELAATYRVASSAKAGKAPARPKPRSSTHGQ